MAVGEAEGEPEQAEQLGGGDGPELGAEGGAATDEAQGEAENLPHVDEFQGRSGLLVFHAEGADGVVDPDAAGGEEVDATLLRLLGVGIKA